METDGIPRIREEALTIARVRDFLGRRDAERKESRIQLWRRAASDCDAIIGRIVASYAPQRIWQWGSVLRREAFREGSDIDLAVEGVPRAEDFFALLGDAMSLTSFPIDIVQMEKIEPEFAELIRAKGSVVYERGN
jgi:predicted nucleotidyltransferase